MPNSPSDTKLRTTNPKILTAIEIGAAVYYFSVEGAWIYEMVSDRCIYRFLTIRTKAEVRKLAIEEVDEWEIIRFGPNEFAVYLPWLLENRNLFITFATSCWAGQARRETGYEPQEP